MDGTLSNIAVHTFNKHCAKFHALVHSVTILHQKYNFPLDYNKELELHFIVKYFQQNSSKLLRQKEVSFV